MAIGHSNSPCGEVVMDNSEMKKALEQYQACKFSIIPIVKQDKRPLVEWKEYQNRRPEAGELGEWYEEYWSEDANIGIVCGKVSGNLVVLDFDNPNEWGDFEDNIEERYGTSIYELTTVVSTGRGHHVYLRTSSSTQSYKLDGVDIKGEGSYVVAPPSIHPSGAEYKFIKPEVTQILEITSLEDVGFTSPPNREDSVESVEVTEIAELVVPYWTEGNRHDLALALTAYLAKLGWALPMVNKLVTLLSGQDNEPKDRLKAIEDTFAKIRANKAVKGFKGLEERLPKAPLDRLEVLAKSARVPEAVRRVDDIRQGEKTSFLKKRHIAEVVTEELTNKGKLLRTTGDELFYFNGSVIPLDSPDLQALLERSFGLNATEVEGRYVLSYLETQARIKGDMVLVYRLAHWDREKGKLYIDCGDNLILKLDGQRIEQVGNGSDGVHFARERWQQAVKPDLENPLDPWKHLINDLSFEIGDKVALTPEQQREVAKLWILGLFFAEELPTKPILCSTGDAGGGKSLLFRRLIRFFYGGGDLDTIRDTDDFWASLSANHLLVLDDVEKDKTPKWVIPELKRASTGQVISLRKLYTTNSQVSFTPRCFVAFTSINPPVEDSALAERLIILRLKKLEKKIPESALLRTITGQRDKLWGGLIKELNTLIPRVLEQPCESTFRMADWASFAERVIGKENVKPLLQGLTSFQDEALLGDSPLPAILDIWTDRRGEWVSAAELYDVWKELAESNHLYFPFKNPRGLAMHLSSMKHNLTRVYGFKSEKRGHGRQTDYYFPSCGEHGELNHDF